MTRVLIVDDDPVQLRLTSEIARKAGFSPVTATGGEEALALLRADRSLGAIVLDLVMPDRDGMAVMEAMAREQIAVPVIVQTAHSSLDAVASATRQGAVDFFVKPVAPERLIVSLRNALRLSELQSVIRTERARITGALGPDDLAASPATHRATGLIRKAAKNDLPVLVEGEAGTGKRRAARIIHDLSERVSRPFIAVDCAALDPRRLDAVLFGSDGMAGKLSEADGGTLFLAEIGALPQELQAKLLAVLQSGELPRHGALRPVRVNFRLIASAGRRLHALAQAGHFREDLYYRLNVLTIYLPPLRERTEDIAALATRFAVRFAAELGKPFGTPTPEALDLLRSHNWPGNILELENAVFRAVALSEAGDPDVADFPQILALRRGRAEAARLTEALPAASAPVHIDAATPLTQTNSPTETVADRFVGDNGEVTPLGTLERELIAFALARYGGHMSKVARALRIGRSTLYRKLREYGLDETTESRAA